MSSMHPQINIVKPPISFTKPKLNAELITKLQLDQTSLNTVYTKLCETWLNKEKIDSEGKRLVSSTLIKHLHDPIILTIIADNLSDFLKYHNDETEKEKLTFYFNFACLCGSEKIIRDFYLKDKDKIQCLIKSDNAIGYALSSGKPELALFLAEVAVSNGKKLPGEVLLYSGGDYQTVEKILKVFHNKHTTGNASKTSKP